MGIYRRNADRSLRELEREWMAQGSPDARQNYISALWRQGQNPYWVTIREHMAHRDTLWYDAELRGAEKQYRDAMEADPNQTYYQEPELYIRSRRHPEGILPWEERPLSGDRIWEFHLIIPRPNDKKIKVGLGKLMCFNTGDEGVMHCTLTGRRNMYSSDVWADRARSGIKSWPEGEPYESLEAAEDEVARSNYALANSLPNSEGHAIANLVLPEEWDPSQPVLASYIVEPVNNPPGDPPGFSGDLLYYPFFTRHMHRGMPPIEVPEGDFYVSDYLSSFFLDYLENSTIEFMAAMRQEVAPLGPRLPDMYEGKHTTLYYWKEYDREREIPGTDDPEDPVYKQHRYVHTVGYRIDQKEGSKARFWRWDNDPGHANPRMLIDSSILSTQVPSSFEEKAANRQKAWQRLQEKIDKFMVHPLRHGFRVDVVEGKPYGSEKPSLWKAGMRYPIHKDSPGPYHFR